MRLNDEDRRQAEAIGAALNEHIVGEDIPEGSFLVRFVVVADYSRPDDTRLLIRVSSDGIEPWERDGMLDLAKGKWE